MPIDGEFALLRTDQAAQLLDVAFRPREPGESLGPIIAAHLAQIEAPRVKSGDLLACFDSWLLPEVSYLPAVLERFERFRECMPTTMIGYDVLPMSEPANYRFKPGSAANVSEYFRLLATADAVVCISEYSRTGILDRLRRDRSKVTTVAHPGGDHLAVRPPTSPTTPVFSRLGTLEARKRPAEILTAFREAVDRFGLDARLQFIGGGSASDETINDAVRAAIASGYPVDWIRGASDAEVQDLVAASSVFLSIGTEGYGIPVLEAIRLGTPVIYDGVQPAGDLMAGRGAERRPALRHDDLVDLFVQIGQPQALHDLNRDLDPQAVPTWADFARAVAVASAR